MTKYVSYDKSFKPASLFLKLRMTEVAVNIELFMNGSAGIKNANLNRLE